jgi:molecular chaperone GrpE
MPSSPASDPGADDGAAVRAEESPPQEPPRQEAAPQESREEVDALRGELAEMEDRFKRARADLENYRKRTYREMEHRLAERHDAVLREWLEVADSVERAVAAGGDPPLAAGLAALSEQIDAVLQRQGVTRFGKPGERFDPERHEAVAAHPSDEHPDGTILEVVRSGYARNGRVLRPAQVVVARSTGTGG